MPPREKVNQPRPIPDTSAEGGARADSASFLTIDDRHEGQRIDNFLASQLKGVPKSHIFRILRSGEVRVNKGRVAASYKLNNGDVIRVPPIRTAKPSIGELDQAKMAEKARQHLSLLYEDEALIVINKPAGMAVHGGSGVSFGVIEALRAKRPETDFLELVHRLDRETSGVLVVAKKRSALIGMHAMLRGEDERKIEKRYFALVRGNWPDAKRSVRLRLSKFLTTSGERRVEVDDDDGAEAHTIFHRVESLPHLTQAATLLDCDLRTGRTHQIRVHLAHLGFPIIGDDKYGDFAVNKRVQAVRFGGLKRMFLHAHHIRFPHPITGESLTVTSPLSPDLMRYLDYLRGRRTVPA